MSFRGPGITRRLPKIESSIPFTFLPESSCLGVLPNPRTGTRFRDLVRAEGPRDIPFPSVSPVGVWTPIGNGRGCWLRPGLLL